MDYEDPYKDIDDLEEIEIEPEPERPLWQRVLQQIFTVAVGLAVVAGLIYLSGFRQFFFYRKTPKGVEVERMESVLQVEEIKVPISAKIIRAEESSKDSERTKEGIVELVKQSSKVWAQADISLTVKSVEIIRMNRQQLDNFSQHPAEFSRQLESFGEGKINTFFIGNLEGPSGLAYSDGNILIADYTTAHDYLVFAHEVGHVLGLNHVAGPKRLMSSEANGSKLTKQEIKKARNKANYLLK